MRLACKAKRPCHESTAKSETVTGEVHHGDTEDTEVCESLHKNLTVMFSVFSVFSVVFSADSCHQPSNPLQ